MDQIGMANMAYLSPKVHISSPSFLTIQIIGDQASLPIAQLQQQEQQHVMRPPL